MSLIKAHRTHGHLAARLDPLGSEPEGDPALDPEPLKLTPELMAQIPASILRVGVPGETLADVLPHLRETYCGTIAYEIEHIASHRQRVWLREKIETGAFRAPLDAEEKRALLRRLTQVDSLERFMHKAYLGQKQFSIEGLDMTVPMLDEMIQLAAAEGAREVVIGMAHRGRLNVLAHNLGRAYETIFREFEGASSIEAVTTIPQGGTGDVKYHHGAQGTYQCGDGDSVLVRLESNPSHLEYVDPVVEGATRAVQTSRQGTHAHAGHQRRDPDHPARRRGLPGPGRRRGDVQPAGARRLHRRRHAAPDPEQPGRLHDRPGRLALHALGLGPREGLRRPDHPRQRRRRRGLHLRRPARVRVPPGVRPRRPDRPDRLPPLRPQRGRRAGVHAAGDDGQDQGQDAGARAVRRRSWSREGTITQEEADALAPGDLGRPRRAATRAQGAARERRRRAADRRLRARPLGLARGQDRGRRAERLQSLNEELLRVPEGFTVHPKLVKQLERRREAIGPDGGIDWAQAESLAYASLLTEGTPVRLTGQDAERGTFSQRHLVLHDPKTGQRDLADPVAAGRAGADGAAQLAAVARSPASASSTATRWRRRRRSCSGRRSSATSSTRRRSSSTSSSSPRCRSGARRRG